MKYQLILQFPSSQKEDYDFMINLEDKLIESLDDNHEVDGHDIGSGEFNIFIHTNEPAEALEVAKVNFTDAELAKMKAACRELGKEEYTIIWPKDFHGEFGIK